MLLAALCTGLGLATAIGALAFGRARRRRWLVWLAHENDRFDLRLHADEAPDGFVRLGSSLEEGDTPSHEPTLEAAAATFVDDGEARVEIPAGTRLLVRRFDGARRLALEHVTTQDGTRTRYSFDLPAKLDFWVLDAPGTTLLPRATDDGPRTLPTRPEGWEITTRKPVMPGDLGGNAPPVRWPIAVGLAAAIAPWIGGEHGLGVAAGLLSLAVGRTALLGLSLWTAPRTPADSKAHHNTNTSATLGRYEAPLFLQRLRDAEEWLLPPRGPFQVIVVDLTDPHSPPGVDPRDDLVGATAFWLAEELWLRTDVGAVSAIPIVVGRARMHRTNADPAWDDIAALRRQYPGRHAFVWGQAEADLEQAGYRLRMRTSEGAGTEEHEVRGTLAELPDRIVEWLVGVGIARRVEPTRGLAGAPAADPYRLLLDRICLQSLMHPRNRALPQGDAPWHQRSVAIAEEALLASPGSSRAELAWLVSGIYAHEAGALDDVTRGRMGDRVRGAGEADPLHALAPVLLERLGWLEEARVVAEERARRARGPYRDDGGRYAAWLAKLGQP